MTKKRKIISSSIWLHFMVPTRNKIEEIRAGAHLDSLGKMIAVIIMIIFIGGGMCLAIILPLK
jgi:hypothetical protein